MSTLSLEDLGYSMRESKVYLALLELGESSVAGVAKRAGINRTTVYPILAKYIRDGLVKKMIKKKKRLFYVEDVNDIKHFLQQKERVVDELLPELRALHNVIPSKPKITYYEGLGGMRDFYLHILDSLSPGDMIREYVGSRDFEKIMPAEFIKFYPDERVRRKILIKTISARTPISEQWERTGQKLLREVRFANNNVPFSSNMQIFKTGVGIISYKEYFMGVIVESLDVSNMFQSAFDLMWGATVK
jgi:HTH-type transcriptional regulator, sugar sensing transcriptional regulator